MSVHVDKVNNHSVHVSLENVENEIESLKKLQNRTPEAKETLARIVFIVRNFSIALGNCNKELIVISWLEDASKALVNIRSYLSTYKANDDAITLRNNCNSQLDILLQASTKLNCVKSNQSLKGITTAENEYISFVNEQNELLVEYVRGLEKEIDDFKKEISLLNSELKKSMQGLEKAVDNEKTRLDGFAVEYQKQMMTDQSEFSRMSESLKSSFNEAQEVQKQIFTEKVQELENSSSSLITSFKEKFAGYERQVVNIVGVLDANMFSHKYKQVADDAKKRSIFWHVIAMVLIVAVGVFAVYAFGIALKEDTSWVKLVARIFATSTMVTGAAYAARQASKQEKVERYARKIEMELVAIDPFIQSMEEEKQSAIKEEIARKIFGNADGMEIGQNEEPYVAMDKLTSIESSLKSLVGLLGKSQKG